MSRNLWFLGDMFKKPAANRAGKKWRGSRGGNFLPARKICLKRIFLKKSSDFVQKVPPNCYFSVFENFCSIPRLRCARALREKGFICNDFPFWKQGKGNILVLDLEVRLCRAQSKTQFCNQSFFLSPLAKFGSDNFLIF